MYFFWKKLNVRGKVSLMSEKAHKHLKYVYFTQTTFVRVSIKFWQYYRQPLLIFLPQNRHRIRISFLEKSYSPFAKWRPLISINLISTTKEMNPIIRKIIKNKISYTVPFQKSGQSREHWLPYICLLLSGYFEQSVIWLPLLENC